VNAGRRYAEIVRGLEPKAIDELWLAPLFGRPVRDAPRNRLDVLRDDIGRAKGAS